jgi:hypothetical protein
MLKNTWFKVAALFFYWMPLEGICLEDHWQLVPFERMEEANSILQPCNKSIFHCPLQEAATYIK